MENEIPESEWFTDIVETSKYEGGYLSLGFEIPKLSPEEWEAYEKARLFRDPLVFRDS